MNNVLTTVLLIGTIFCTACTTSVSAVEVCADWNKLIKELYILKNNSQVESNETKLKVLAVCPIPGPLADLQIAKNYAYAKLEGRENCPLEEFAILIAEKWDQPIWTLRCEGDAVYNEALVTITEKDGETCAVRVNLPQWISGLEKSIARDGYFDPTGQIVVRNTIRNVTELKLFNAAA